ncbi:lamin tail domain-containing protein [Candidatus Peregrinibacteria bacterium]|nr:lamin tail domain-containing protein [Candidatus Peregrinibacteria bacterium]
MKISGKIRRGLAGWQLVMMAMGLVGNFMVVEAAAPGAVVINEVAWAGSPVSANDEWLELYNPGAGPVDLAGWKIRDDGVDAFTFPAGSNVAGGGYFLIEDSENAVPGIAADAIYNMSLANSGDTIQLIDSNGVVIDTVNGSGGAWYAGSSSNFSSMERIAANGGDNAANFAASTGNGGTLMATPRAVNSVVGGSIPVSGTNLEGEWNVAKADIGDTVEFKVQVNAVDNLFSYGLVLNYDAAKLQYIDAAAGTFLSAAGAVPTSFQKGLESNQPGKLQIAEARTTEIKAGANGTGELAVITFKVLDGEGEALAPVLAAQSFLASPNADINFTAMVNPLNVNEGTLQLVTNLVVSQGTERYQLKLNWTASLSNTDHYRVERLDAHGQWKVLAGVTSTEFIDQDGVASGGRLIPQVIYQYRVTAVKGAVTSVPAAVSGQETRGLRGDNNRSDLIDGRDLENLAKHFAETDVLAGFDVLVDTTYDGRIDGSDLIDIGAGFAQKYV